MGLSLMCCFFFFFFRACLGQVAACGGLCSFCWDSCLCALSRHRGTFLVEDLPYEGNQAVAIGELAGSPGKTSLSLLQSQETFFFWGGGGGGGVVWGVGWGEA